MTKIRRKDYNVVHVDCIEGTKRILRDKRRNKWINTALLVKRQDAEEPEKQECKTKRLLLGQKITQFRGQARTCKWVVRLCPIAVSDTKNLRYIYLKTNRC